MTDPTLAGVAPMPVAALVDFGNTLADETFMRRSCPRFPEWITHYGEVLDRVRSDWDRGVIGSEQVASEVAKRLGCTPDSVDQYMTELCSDLHFYPAINAALAGRRSRGRRQAIVTVNCDLFDRVADFYELGSTFDVIVSSSHIGSDSKVDICLVACERLGVPPAQSVLIDNIAANVEAWIAVGGLGYVFESDEQFSDDVRARRVPGFDPHDLGSSS